MHVGIVDVIHVDGCWTGPRLEDEEDAVGVLLNGKQVGVVVHSRCDLCNGQELGQDEGLLFRLDPALDGKLLRFHETIDHGSDGPVAFKGEARCQWETVIAASSDAPDGLSCGQ